MEVQISRHHGGRNFENGWVRVSHSLTHSVLVYAFLGSNKHYISSYGSIHVFVTKHETLSPLVWILTVERVSFLEFHSRQNMTCDNMRYEHMNMPNTSKRKKLRLNCVRGEVTSRVSAASRLQYSALHAASSSWVRSFILSVSRATTKPYE